jgi:S-formylglutathione hydrolase FrmB
LLENVSKLERDGFLLIQMPLITMSATTPQPHHKLCRDHHLASISAQPVIGGKFNRLLRSALALLLACTTPILTAAEARFEVIQISSRALKNNPLHDPSVRSVEIFYPAQATNNQPLPIVYYLPGFGQSSDNIIKNPGPWLSCVQAIADKVTPMLLVMVDGHTRWGGSQYLNSTAQGNYASYVCDDIIAAVEAQHRVPANGIRRIIAGHSSGGFGALRLGMARQKLYDGVIALSPDSDFPISHLPLLKVASVANVPLAKINRIARGETPMPERGGLTYAIALSAAYAPRGYFHRGQFEWVYDDQGNFRQEVWQRWLDNDPLTIALKKKARTFSVRQSIYLDGAAQDAFLANIGARKIFEVLREYPGRYAFYEPPGHHGDHISERLERGLAWLFDRPVSDIK